MLPLSLILLQFLIATVEVKALQRYYNISRTIDHKLVQSLPVECSALRLFPSAVSKVIHSTPHWELREMMELRTGQLFLLQTYNDLDSWTAAMAFLQTTPLDPRLMPRPLCTLSDPLAQSKPANGAFLFDYVPVRSLSWWFASAAAASKEQHAVDMDAVVRHVAAQTLQLIDELHREGYMLGSILSGESTLQTLRVH